MNQKGDLQNHHDDLVELPYSKKLWWGKSLAKTGLLQKTLAKGASAENL